MQQLASNYKKQNPEASQQQVKDYLNHQKQIQATKQIKQQIGKVAYTWGKLTLKYIRSFRNRENTSCVSSINTLKVPNRS